MLLGLLTAAWLWSSMPGRYPVLLPPLKKIHIAYYTDSHPSATLHAATQFVLKVVIKKADREQRYN